MWSFVNVLSACLQWSELFFYPKKNTKQITTLLNCNLKTCSNNKCNVPRHDRNLKQICSAANKLLWKVLHFLRKPFKKSPVNTHFCVDISWQFSCRPRAVRLTFYRFGPLRPVRVVDSRNKTPCIYFASFSTGLHAHRRPYALTDGPLERWSANPVHPKTDRNSSTTAAPRVPFLRRRRHRDLLGTPNPRKSDASADGQTAIRITHESS